MSKTIKLKPVADFPCPVLGFVAFSGTGKTTLLEQVIPLLRQKNLRIGIVKGSHHDFEIDQPGKDSHRLRQAGANQTLLVSKHRAAWIEEFTADQTEPTLAEALDMLDPTTLDLVLVEGLKGQRFSKIELHRPALGKPRLHTEDRDIVAIATDAELKSPTPNIPVLNINSPADIALFVLELMAQK